VRHEPWLTVHAHRRPDALALVAAGGERLTWGELGARARAGAGALTARGLAPGQPVALTLPPGLDFAVALHACLLLRTPALPVDPRLAAPERAARVRAAAAVVDAPLPAAGPRFEPRPFAADEPALVVHTSGTTSEAKPVTLTYGNLAANALGSALALGLDRDERWLCPLPLSHVGGLMVLVRSLVYGTAAVLRPPPFDAAALAGALNTGEATLASLVPTMLARALDAGLADPPGLRAILLGGGPAPPALLARARDAGVPVAQTYGLTEACSQVTVSAPGEAETAGWPLPGIRMWLEEDGEILVAGPAVAGGGVLRTGDLGRLDARGRLTVTGRKADTIVSGGENVAPTEVEAALLEHPAVADAGVFGRPDGEWGEVVTAHVVLRSRAVANPAMLREHCAARLARYKVPKDIRLVPSLPRTTSGKLLRRALPQAHPASLPPADG
jgi:O-succinylbenzoic acid--CoA ligase